MPIIFVGTPICPSVGLEQLLDEPVLLWILVGTPICPSVGLERQDTGVPPTLPVCRNADLPECGIGTAALSQPSARPETVGTPICPSVGLELIEQNLHRKIQ